MNKKLLLLLVMPLLGITMSLKAQQVISQNNSLSIAIGVGLTCNESGINGGGGKVKETHFYRYFDLPNNHNITTGFSVSSVKFGILWFSSGGAGYPITINIYSAEIGTFPSVNSTLQGTATYVATGNEMFSVIELDLSANIPAGEAMIMEMVLPEDGVTNVTPGFNMMGDSAPTYMMAEDCDLSAPATLASLSPDFNNLAIVFVVLGNSCDAVDVPYLLDFESADAPEIPTCTQVENVSDGNDWEVYSGISGDFNGQYLKYTSHSSNAANVWFYTKGINLIEGKTYKISYDYGSASFPENLKIAYGNTKSYSEMTNVLAEHTEIVSEGNRISNTVEFSANSSGVYYFGFNAFSSANQGELYVDDILIELVEIEDPDQCSIEYEGQLAGALGNLQELILAADFKIEANTTMELNQFIVNIFGDITDATIYLYEDDYGMPGNLIHTFNHLIPDSQTYIGSNFGYFIYENIFTLPETIQLDAGSSEATYWIGLETTAGSQGMPNAWEKENSFHGYLAYYSNDGGYSWIDISTMDLAFQLNGICGMLNTKDIEEFDFSYYPNPVKDILNINSQKTIKSVEIFNVTGQNIFKTEKIENKQINLSTFKSGIYFFKITLESGEIETFKILKK